MEQTMYDTILGLPLFQGLSHSDLTRILESTRLQFETVAEGDVLLQQGQQCTGLTFIISGTINARTASADNRWSVDEELSGQMVLGMDVLYGSTRTHRQTVTTLTPTRVLYLNKRTVAAFISYFEVFRLNVLNLLTTSAVRRDQLNWLPPATTLEGLIIDFMRRHLTRPAGHKRFNISQRVLGSYLREDYRYVARALQNLKDKHLLTTERRLIDIPAFELLLTSTATITNS